jgi:hypothetical protein
MLYRSVAKEKFRFRNFVGFVECIIVGNADHLLGHDAVALQRELNMGLIEYGLLSLINATTRDPDNTTFLKTIVSFMSALLTLQKSRASISECFLEDAALLRTALDTLSETSPQENEDAWGGHRR